MKTTLFGIIIIFVSSCLTFSQQYNVTVITLDGSINPASADYVHYGIERAEENNSECLILKLNTPGGLLKSTRVIVSDFLESKIPIVVFVYPAGSQAASAGVFITVSANIAAMAPGTNLGAAHPVILQGQMDSVMNEKATNDAAAFIRSISEKRKRNISWTEEAVRKSLSITESEALKLNVIDLVAENLTDLLLKLNGKEVETASGKIILNTKNARPVYIPMTFSQQILNIFSDPNIAYILFMIGIYGLLFELYNPGSIFPGVVGGISLILALYTMHTLPINYAGLALIIFAIILFLLEIKIVSHGILTIGGVISLLIGSLMLINVKSGLEIVSISWEIILLFVILTTLFFLFAIGFGIKAQNLKTKTGSEGLVGEIGKAISDINPIGQVLIHGEIWTAESSSKINKDDAVKVISVSSLKLQVEKVS